jgi:hypothetical protein
MTTNQPTCASCGCLFLGPASTGALCPDCREVRQPRPTAPERMIPVTCATCGQPLDNLADHSECWRPAKPGTFIDDYHGPVGHFYERIEALERELAETAAARDEALRQGAADAPLVSDDAGLVDQDSCINCGWGGLTEVSEESVERDEDGDGRCPECGDVCDVSNSFDRIRDERDALTRQLALYTEEYQRATKQLDESRAEATAARQERDAARDLACCLLSMYSFGEPNARDVREAWASWRADDDPESEEMVAPLRELIHELLHTAPPHGVQGG